MQKDPDYGVWDRSVNGDRYLNVTTVAILHLAGGWYFTNKVYVSNDAPIYL